MAGGEVEELFAGGGAGGVGPGFGEDGTIDSGGDGDGGVGGVGEEVVDGDGGGVGVGGGAGDGACFARGEGELVGVGVVGAGDGGLDREGFFGAVHKGQSPNVLRGGSAAGQEAQGGEDGEDSALFNHKSSLFHRI